MYSKNVNILLNKEEIFISSSYGSRAVCLNTWVWLFDRRFGYFVVTDRSARLIIRENKR